jgi:hypothetical protein
MNLRLNLTAESGRLRKYACPNCPGLPTYQLFLRPLGKWGCEYFPILVELKLDHLVAGADDPDPVELVEHVCRPATARTAGRARAVPAALAARSLVEDLAARGAVGKGGGP